MADENGKAGENIQEFARDVYRQADTARKDAVKQLFEVADNIRSRAREAEGEARFNADRIARNLEQTANYLNGRAVDQVEDATEAMRDNVWKSAAAVFIIGLLVGLLLARKS